MSPYQVRSLVTISWSIDFSKFALLRRNPPGPVLRGRLHRLLLFPSSCDGENLCNFVPTSDRGKAADNREAKAESLHVRTVFVNFVMPRHSAEQNLVASVLIPRPFAQLLGTYEIKDTASHLDVQTRQLTGYETLIKQPLN